MIAWTIEAAQGSRYIDRLVLSTDDSADRRRRQTIRLRRAVHAAGRACNRPSRQHGRHPPRAAVDRRSDTTIWCCCSRPRRCGSQPISMPRWSIVCKRNAPACLSVCEPRQEPVLDDDAGGRRHRAAAVSRRSDSVASPGRAAECLRSTAPYMSRRCDHLAAGGDFLTAGAIGYVMPKERSLDIDTELDLKIADFLLTQGQR